MTDKNEKPEEVYARVRNTDPGERFFHAEGKQVSLAPGTEQRVKMTRAEFDNVASLNIDVEEISAAEYKTGAAEAEAAKPKAAAKPATKGKGK